MSHRRTIFFVVIAVLVLVSQTPAQLPNQPPKRAGDSVTGAFEGWYQLPDGSYNMLVGYMNRNSEELIDVPVGPNNKIEPGPPDQGQPTHFLTRRQWGVFTVNVPKDFGKKVLTWTITSNGETNVIPLKLDPLWIVEPLKDAAVGNTPPTIQFQPNGKILQGPPIGIAATYTTKIADPLIIDVWSNDDGKAPPEAGARGGNPRGTVSWSKYRGPGTVTFSNARPTPSAQDGKSTVTVKFSAPGEYMLRVQVNDRTGDGGGGFQCCWTNAHVKVTVTGSTAQ